MNSRKSASSKKKPKKGLLSRKKMDIEKKYPKYFNYLLFAAIAILAFFVIKPFISPLIAAAIFAYVCYPIFRVINKAVKNRGISSFIMTVLLLALIIVPIGFGVNLVAKESYKFYIVSKQRIYSENLINVECFGKENLACSINAKFKEWVKEPKTRYYLEDGLTKITNFIFEKASGMIVALPMILFKMFVMFFVMFFLFKDGHAIIQAFEDLLPMKSDHQRRFISKTKEIIQGTVYGSLLTAMIQGIVAGIGYAIFGLENPIILGIMTAFAALIPFLGTGLVYVPLSVGLILQGAGGQLEFITKGILLLLYGLLIISTMDNFLKPHLIGKQANVHPVLILVGVFGGLSVMGIIGIVVGPLILELLFIFLDYYRKEGVA